MRIDRLVLTASVLTGALLSAAPRALLAQDTLEAVAEEVQVEETVTRSGDRVVTGDLTINPGELVEGRVVVLNGDLAIHGHVTGDVTVTRGDLSIQQGAQIDGSVKVIGGDVTNGGSVGGDLQVVGGRLVTRDGVVAGEMRIMDQPGASAAARSVDDHPGRQAMGSRGGWMRRIGDGLGGLASTVAFGLLLAGLGAGLVFFAHPQLDRMSDSVRQDTLRAAGLGLAANFLVFPVFVLGLVLLAVSLIGIPLLLLFVPLFPVAVGTLAACGLVSVAHAVGERSAERGGSFEARYRNSYTYVFTGLGILLAPLVAANLLKLTGFLYGLGSLLEILSWFGLWLAATVGIGAVLLTRGGMGPHWRWKRRSYDPIIDGDAFGGSHA